MLGSCLCGAVVFEVTPPLRDVVACHCRQCRKTSGHYWAASTVPLERFRIVTGTGLSWYRSSPAARRGFCRVCGASLFWKPEGEDCMSFSPAALDGPSGLVTAMHIFVEDAGDYYAPEGPPPGRAPAPARVAASCLCGGVQFTLPRPAGGVVACHCAQCRKTSGHYAASFEADGAALEFRMRATLSEYETPRGGRRGFCTACGSSLYFRDPDGALSVEAGSVDGATGCTLGSHIFVAAQGDYYRLDDGLPQHPGWG